MSIIDFLRDWLGVSSDYDWIIVFFACVFGLLIIDNILRCIFGVISSLFKK